MKVVFALILLLADGGAHAQPAEPPAPAVARAGKQLVRSRPSRPAPVDEHNWIRHVAALAGTYLGARFVPAPPVGDRLSFALTDPRPSE
jgi:hypothetical protein